MCKQNSRHSLSRNYEISCDDYFVCAVARNLEILDMHRHQQQLKALLKLYFLVEFLSCMFNHLYCSVRIIIHFLEANNSALRLFVFRKIFWGNVIEIIALSFKLNDRMMILCSYMCWSHCSFPFKRSIRTFEVYCF